MSNTSGRLDGAEKAHRHIQLCRFYVAAVRGVEEDSFDAKCGDDFDAVHDATQELTDNLDTAIGFPIDDDRPDYDSLEILFFNKFHDLALKALGS